MSWKIPKVQICVENIRFSLDTQLNFMFCTCSTFFCLSARGFFTFLAILVYCAAVGSCCGTCWHHTLFKFRFTYHRPSHLSPAALILFRSVFLSCQLISADSLVLQVILCSTWQRFNLLKNESRFTNYLLIGRHMILF